jgi:hypothetical protein
MIYRFIFLWMERFGDNLSLRGLGAVEFHGRHVTQKMIP